MSQYSKAIVEWAQFCGINDYDKFNPKEDWVMEWLVQKFNRGASHGTLNTCRSAISLLCGEYIGKSPLISRLLKGVFKQKPSKPKYDRIYSLDPVISRIEKLAPLDSLSLQQLTSKLAILLALVTAHRKQTLISIKRKNIKKVNDGYEIEISERIKTSRPGAYQPLLILPRFKERPNLCVASVLEKYLDITSATVKETDALFITTRKPFKKASKDTLSRWIRSFLTECGIGQEYAPHSIRHAATSAAMAKGVDINIIKNSAGWSGTSKVFDVFYNRPIVQDKRVFSKTILS